MIDASASPKGYCYPKLVISHAVYLYHRLPISVGDGQELLFERGIDVSHETVRAWCVKFGSDLAEALRQRKPKQGCVWHRGEMRIVLGDVTHWLWRAVNEHGEVLDEKALEWAETAAPGCVKLFWDSVSSVYASSFW